MHDLKRKLKKEIEEISQDTGRLGMGELQTLHLLTDTLKNIHKIEHLEDGGYSEARHYVRAHYSNDGRGYDGRSYGDGRDYSEARRDRMGRYSGDGRDEMTRHLESALATAGPGDREMIEHMLNKMR